MILHVQRQVHETIADAARQQYNLSELPPFAVEVPPNRALGDLAVTLPFQLARTLKKAPRAIAQELAARLGPLPGVTRVDVAPNGFLNLFLERSTFVLARVRGEVAAVRADEPKTIVEHTAINPNKAAHIGHLRNAALGFSLYRVLHLRDPPA